MKWREQGDVPYATWKAMITAAGGPPELASRESWEAARPHSALILAMMGVESRWGSTERLNKLVHRLLIIKW